MNPYNGDVFQLREMLTEKLAEPGERIDPDELRRRVEELDDPTADELAALEASALVAITEQAAQKLSLGQRELERRKRRRKAARASRKANR